MSAQHKDIIDRQISLAMREADEVIYEARRLAEGYGNLVDLRRSIESYDWWLRQVHNSLGAKGELRLCEYAVSEATETERLLLEDIRSIIGNLCDLCERIIDGYR